jgi:hypothetical protein
MLQEPTAVHFFERVLYMNGCPPVLGLPETGSPPLHEFAYQAGQPTVDTSPFNIFIVKPKMVQKPHQLA